MGLIKLKSNRNLFLDAVKGFAILLVVIGHAIQVNDHSFDHNFIFRIIYSFHMPLFMAVSGYIEYLQYQQKHSLNFIRKVKRLVVPFLCWYLICYPVFFITTKISFADYIANVIRSPEVGLWFLWVLFLGYALLDIVLLVLRRFKKNEWVDISLIIIVFLIRYSPINILGIDILKWFFFFFVLGYISAKYLPKFYRYKRIVQMGAVLIFISLISWWMRDDNHLFIPVLKQNPNISGSTLRYIVNAYNFIVPLTGIVVALTVVEFITYWSKSTEKVLAWLGYYSLDIYAIQFVYFFVIGVNKSFLVALPGQTYRIVFTALVALIVSLIVSIGAIRKNRFLSLLFLGQNITSKGSK